MVLSAKYRGEITLNGYGSDVMKSALQKYIRRGMLSSALYAAGELDLFKEAKEDRAEAVRTNFIHRLMIIYLEDVENLSILKQLDSLFSSVLAEREKINRNKTKEEEWISEIVYLLASSKKARVCSHIRAIFNPKYRALHASYPSIKKMWDDVEIGDNYQLFRESLSKKSISAIYYAFQIDASTDKIGRRKAVWFIFDELKKLQNMDIFEKWYKKELGTVKEGFMCWLLPLLHYLGIVSSGQTVKPMEQAIHWDRNRAMEKIKVEDFVLDRHTRKGHKKSLVEFAEVGAFVENEFDFIVPLWKKFYDNGKRYEDDLPVDKEEDEIPIEDDLPVSKEEDEIPIEDDLPVSKEEDKNKEFPLESESYLFVVRAQLNTGGSKMDVYFATDKGKLVIIKGPYENRESMSILQRNMDWKRRNNLPYIPFLTRRLIPDRWPEGVPLGARNKIDRTKPAWFIIFDSVVKESDIIKKIHSSKLWPDTEVVDWDKVGLHFDYKKSLTQNELIDYVHAVLFRYIRGVHDLADRNFLKVAGRIISIDEDVEHHEVKLRNELRVNKAAFLHKWLSTNYDLLSVQTWLSLEDKDERKRLILVQSKELCIRLFE